MKSLKHELFKKWLKNKRINGHRVYGIFIEALRGETIDRHLEICDRIGSGYVSSVNSWEKMKLGFYAWSKVHEDWNRYKNKKQQ